MNPDIERLERRIEDLERRLMIVDGLEPAAIGGPSRTAEGDLFVPGSGLVREHEPKIDPRPADPAERARIVAKTKAEIAAGRASTRTEGDPSA